MKGKSLTFTRIIAALMTTDRLFLLDAAQLALRNKPAFSTHSAQNTTLCDFLAEAPEQLFL
jgi:hypothetical protein